MLGRATQDGSVQAAAAEQHVLDQKSIFGLATVAILAVILCLPFSRTVSWADEGVLLHGAERLLHGDKLYTDFFEFLPPGGFLITAGWFTIFGTSIISARLLQILTITAIASLTYLACLRISKSSFFSSFLAIAWIVMSQGFWTQLNHHWFTTLFSMLALWTVLNTIDDNRSARGPIIAGLAAGAAGMITPTRGALAVIASVMAFIDLQRNLKEAILFLLAVAVVPICLVVYVASEGTLTTSFNDVVLFTLAHYASIQSVPFASGVLLFATALV